MVLQGALPFPAEPVMVKGNFPELNSSNTQGAVKIVTVIFSIIGDERDL
jgi:hypothetical protein